VILVFLGWMEQEVHPVLMAMMVNLACQVSGVIQV